MTTKELVEKGFWEEFFFDRKTNTKIQATKESKEKWLTNPKETKDWSHVFEAKLAI